MKVITNAFWLSFCRIAADVLSFALFAVISRAFGPAGTGQYSYAFALAALVSLVSTSGFEDYGIRQYARAAARERPALWEAMICAQTLQLLIGAAALAAFLGLSRTSAGNATIIIELSVYLVGWNAARTFFVPALASQSMVAPAFTDLVCRLSAILAALALAAFAHPSLQWMLAAFPIAGIVLPAVALRSAAKHGARPRFGGGWRGIIATWRGTSGFVGSEILNQFYARTDLLLIAYFLGDAQVGLYSTDIKFVEVGILPLVLLGTAAYPLLSAHAAGDPSTFEESGGDFTRIVFFCSGWLAVGIYFLVPLLIVPLFGVKFAPSAAVLPWFALFALMKGWEVAFYRLLYATRRQGFYFGALVMGTVLIVALNFPLIPAYGIRGAIAAAIVAILAVDLCCAVGLIRHLGTRILASAAVRVAIALIVTFACALLAQKASGSAWVGAIAACTLFPLLGLTLRLMPHPRRSLLLRQPQAES
jgi:O-antigen/teichoic acid export membrane protein